jgi:hypothetical protein
LCIMPRVEWHYLRAIQPRVYPISAKIIVWRFDGRVAFVPEGQFDSSQARSAWVGFVPEGQFDGSQARSAWVGFVPEGQFDGSQARSAWVAMQRDPVPEGRLKSLSVPQICCDRFNRPAGTGLGYFPHDSRHFVPGYYRAVPPGQKPSAHRGASQLT